MRNYILILLLQLTNLFLFGQGNNKFSFMVTILDTAQLESITTNSNRLIPSFSDSGVNTLLSRYTITKFEQAYPSSRYEYLRNVWLVESNSMGLMDSLVSSKPSLFCGAEALEEGMLTYTPNDYGYATDNEQKDLDLIRAKDAWDVTHGNPNVLIGITDTKFKVDHEDLENQILTVLSNNTTAEEHGTMVAGAAAAEADNSKGISGIGFDCKLVVSDQWANDNVMLTLSNNGIRILNGSWINRCYTPSFTGQGIYNEIYENGTIGCFGAGNGFNQCHFIEAYPAAYDHNISVSSVGCEKNYGEKSWWPGLPDSIYWGMKDVHWNVVGEYDTYWDNLLQDSVVRMSEIHNHNPAVDICAPGYRVRVTTSSGYTANGWGTSFASPLVAGTCGLMLSANSCLTPYQMEYGLKTTAHNIYNIPENEQFDGLLGAGRLDAGAAVSWAENHDCNSLYTTTFNIKGIELNTVCRPGQSTNVVNPKFIPVLENGTAPYTYKWEAISGNSTTLTSYTAAQPEIVTSSSPHRAYYRLTVYDNSSVQKVASQVIDITLVDSQTYDLVVRDSYLDMYKEPNTQLNVDKRDWDVFQSPDVWNRKTQDDVTVHENPEYFVHNPNYVYARVRNVGCVANPSGRQLHLYWTKASTGEKWSEDWTTANITGSAGIPVAAGREITTTPISIPVIQPGGEWVTNSAWYPIDPIDYDSTINSVDVCFLARITESSSSPYGMAFTEVTQVKQNIFNNNNISTRNFIVTNFLPGDERKRHQILVRNIETYSQTFDFQLISDRAVNPHFSGDLSAVGSVTIYLGDLYDRWDRSGKRGTYLSANDSEKSVEYDGSQTMLLQGIELDASEKIPIIIEFNGYGNSEIPHTIFFRQLSSISSTDPVYGSVTFYIEPVPDTLFSRSSKETSRTEKVHYSIYPNPSSNIIYLSYLGSERENKISYFISNSFGQQVGSLSSAKLVSVGRLEIDVNSLPPGVYFLSINDKNGRKTLKFVKV